MQAPQLSAKTHIALGLSLLVATLLLGAAGSGLLPDRERAAREGRAALAEAISFAASELVERGEERGLERVLGGIAERNVELLSIALRRSDGSLWASSADHDGHWDPGAAQGGDDQLQVPLFRDGQHWGDVELAFAPLALPGPLGFALDPRLALVGFMAVGSFLGFSVYLRRALRYLDPSQAVPPHVRSALDTLAEGLLLLDAKGQIVLGNRAFASMLGCAPEALVGRRAGELAWQHGDGSTPAEYPWQRAIAQRAPEMRAMLYLAGHSAERRTFHVNCSPVFVGGRCGGVLVSLDDVTQLEQHKVELAHAKEEAEAANRAKSAFLANMSHEIRTPLNAILGFAQLLRRGYTQGRVDGRKCLDTITSSGEHLLQLINDVLDLSKVESGRVEVERIRFAPHTLVQDVIQVLSVRARERNLALELEIRESIPETILSDPTRLRQILTNLISNALKFTSEGQVVVAMGLRGEGARRRMWLAVRDTGIGVAAQVREAIFDPFVQADSSITRRFGGTGLGLPISRRFARLLGGDIEVESGAQGSSFIATLDPGPLDGVRMLEPREALRASREARDDWGHWRFPDSRVLVVDDGEANRELLRVVLEEVGLHVECAGDGREALARAANGHFDLILMDMQMPVLDGYSATRALREQGVGAAIVAVTGDAMKGSESRCLEAGCDRFVLKPIHFETLLGTLAGLLGGERCASQLADGEGVADPESLPAPRARPAPVRAAAAAAQGPLVSRLAGRSERFAQIAARFARQLPDKLAEMELLWQRREFAELAKLAHWLKGSSGTVGFDAFTRPASALESLARDEKEADIPGVLEELQALAERIQAPAAAPTAARRAGGGA